MMTFMLFFAPFAAEKLTVLIKVCRFKKAYARSLQSQKATRHVNPPFNKKVSKTT